MGILYQAADPLYWVIWLFILFALMAFNELGRTSLWAGIALFAVVPIVLTVFVWPITAAPGNEYGTGTWFNWVKTYSALAGCLGFMALRFVKWRGADGTTHHLYATFRCSASACGKAAWSRTCGLCRVPGTS